MLPLGKPSIPSIKKTEDVRHQLIDATILLDYVLSVAEPGVGRSDGRRPTVGDRITHCRDVFSHLPGVRWALGLRNSLVHDVAPSASPRQMADAANILLQAIQELSPRVPAELVRAIHEAPHAMQQQTVFEHVREASDMEGGQDGLRIWTRFTASGLREVNSYLGAWFFSASGLPVLDQDGALVDEQGKVLTGRSFKPAFDEQVIQTTLFIPSVQLHQSIGIHQIQYHLQTFSQARDRWLPLSTTPLRAFVVTVPETPDAIVTRLDPPVFDEVRDNQVGLGIPMSVTFHALRGASLYVRASFTFQGGHRIGENDVVAGEPVTPERDTDVKEIKLFLPYRSLPLLPRFPYHLRHDVQIFRRDGPAWRQISRVVDRTFWLRTDEAGRVHAP